MKLLRPSAAVGMAAGAFVANACVAVELYRNENLRGYLPLPVLAAIRNTITLTQAATIAFDYHYSLRGLDAGTQEYKIARRLCHERTGKRLLKLCLLHGGSYVKAGQQVASYHYVLPREFTAPLATLQDNGPQESFATITETIQEQLSWKAGRKIQLDDVFVDLNERPVASASLAQVHRAVLKTGEEVAVKVQKRFLSDLVAADIHTLRIVLWALEKHFQGLEVSWLLPELESALHKELDFEAEAENSEKIASMMTKSKLPVYIPKVYKPYTTRKLLTMEFVRGIKVNNVEGLEAMGLSPRKVGEILIQAFDAMTFSYGFVHADPHPGNILVRRTMQGKPEIVLLDHGLYRSLGDDLRLLYCYLWQAMFLRDASLLELIGKRLGAGELFELIPLIFTQSLMSGPSTMGKSIREMTQEERQRIRSVLRQFRRDQFSDFYASLPRDLLFVIRANDYIRGISLQLSVPHLCRFHLMARAAVSEANAHFVKSRGRGPKELRWCGHSTSSDLHAERQEIKYPHTGRDMAIWKTWLLTTYVRALVEVVGFLSWFWTPRP